MWGPRCSCVTLVVALIPACCRNATFPSTCKRRSTCGLRQECAQGSFMAEALLMKHLFAARTVMQFNYFFFGLLMDINCSLEKKKKKVCPASFACPAFSADLSGLRHTVSLSPHHPSCMDLVTWVLLIKMRKVSCSVTGVEREWRLVRWRRGVTCCTIFPPRFTELLSSFSLYFSSCLDLAAKWEKSDPWGSGLLTSAA